MEYILDLLRMLIPALLVFAGMWYMMRTFITREQNEADDKIRLLHRERTLPLRLQAYERLILFTERLAPENILLRVNQPGCNVATLQSAMLSSIRQEFEHNLSQQLYVSSLCWASVRTAKEEMVQLINSSAALLDKEAPGTEMAGILFQRILEKEGFNLERVRELIRQEAFELF